MTDLGTTIIDCRLEGIEQPIPFHEWNHPSCKGNHQTFINEYHNCKRNKVIPIGGTVIDIGAFTGDTSLAYALLAGPRGRVLAFEPNPQAVKVLRLNSAVGTSSKFDLACCTLVLPWAISNTHEKRLYAYSDAEFCNGGDPTYMGDLKQQHGHAVEVECTTLDHIAKKLKRIDFIKIDAEGADAEILHSISDVVRKFKPILKMEMYPGLTQIQRSRFHHLIRSLGYLVYEEEGSCGVLSDEWFLRPGAIFDFIARPV